MAGEPRYAQLWGADVADEATYQRYREGMLPILGEYGGGFAHDFAVSRVLRSEAAQPINRVFLIRFPSRAAATAFFADPRYLAVRSALFVPSVRAITRLADFDEPG